MNKRILWFVLFLVVAIALYGLYSEFAQKFTGAKSDTQSAKEELDLSSYETAVFSGGCFWCSEADFEKTDGVVEAISGYTGGTTVNPTYKQTSSGTTGHREAVEVYYDPSIVTYEQLLDVFWRHHDPTDAGGSFGDRGSQYSSAVYYKDVTQRSVIEASQAAVEATGVLSGAIVSAIVPTGVFYVAEDYHQDYYLRNASRYGFYRSGSGRDAYIEKTWGSALADAQHHAGGDKAKKDLAKKVVAQQVDANPYYTADRDELNFPITYTDYVKPSQEILRANLNDIQYKVTQKEGTERPFYNAYWDNHKEGIYVDIVSGEPLFSSTDKYDSGTGWPSFLKPIAPGVVTEHDDYKLIARRTEIRSAIADHHLGHIILDGPADNDFIRYCMNSAALRFVAVEDMEAQGYDAFLILFAGTSS